MIALFLDTETTGLIDNHSMPLEKQPEVIELYACLVEMSSALILEEIDTLLKPKNEITEEITKINHITNEMVKDAPTFGGVFPQFRDMLAKAKVVIAHNASYDLEMMDIECERINQMVGWPRKICTIEQTMHLKGFRLSLMALHQHLFNEPFPEAHRAKGDVMALVRCAVELYKRGDL